MDIDRLNAEHGIEGTLRIVEGRGGLAMIEIDNGLARATISPYAGQVLSYVPAGATEDLLFLGDKAYFQEGKAIKGGIPICWPWFGPDPEDKGRAAHGFARSWPWTVLETQSLRDGSTKVSLGIADDFGTRAVWPQYFNLVLEITVGATLMLELITRNAGDTRFSITQGFHTYFKVGDIRHARVTGLDGCRYIDKTADDAVLTQEGPISVDREINRIYESVPAALAIEDEALHRRIRIRSGNSATCVVWNPWIETAKAMGDLDDEDYKVMLCVETLNAESEVIEVPAHGEHRLTAEYEIEGL